MKTFIVTGASSGIGYHTVLSLLEKDFKVLAIARSADKLKALSDAAGSKYLITATADLTQAADLEQVRDMVTGIGEISGLINNAGILINKSFAETTAEEWKSTFEVNVFAAAELVRILMPCFNASSHIVNISSMGGFQGSLKYPGLSAYSASKGALAILTECLSAELASSGISVNCLCIGAVETEMFRRAFPGYHAPVKANEMGQYLANFVAEGHLFYNGKIIPVAVSNPK